MPRLRSLAPPLPSSCRSFGFYNDDNNMMMMMIVLIVIIIISLQELREQEDVRAEERVPPPLFPGEPGRDPALLMGRDRRVVAHDGRRCG